MGVEKVVPFSFPLPESLYARLELGQVGDERGRGKEAGRARGKGDDPHPRANGDDSGRLLIVKAGEAIDFDPPTGQLLSEAEDVGIHPPSLPLS
jgi:hypothetical protein